MKLEHISYEHVDNGMSLELVPETTIEAGLLKSFWLHGHLSNLSLKTGDGGSDGFYIDFRPQKEEGR